MTQTLFSRIWLALTSIPPIRADNLLPLVVMVILWVGFSWLRVPEQTAFVVVVVLAQAYAVWRSLPSVEAGLKRVGGPSRMIFWPVLGVLVLAILQLLLNDALFTQRVLSAICVFILVVMVLGILREKEVLDRVVHDVGGLGPSVERVSLLRINALAAAAVIAVNETLIAFESLTVWITIMPVFALLLHGAYWFLVLMVLPPERARA